MEDSMKKEIISWIKACAFATIIAIICREFIFTPTTVLGKSMSPTYENSDKIVVSKTSKIEHFDVIVFNAPDNKGERYIKRVIGLPGDSIQMKDDILYINGEAFFEPYLKENKEENVLDKLTEDFTLQEKYGVVEVPANMLFVMGDNRLISNDSRIFGFISNDSVIGEVKFRFYPFQKFGMPE